MVRSASSSSANRISLIPAPPAPPVVVSSPVPRSLRRLAVAGMASLALLPQPLRAQTGAGNVAESRPAATSGMAARVQAVLARSHLQRARWGIEVRDAATGAPLFTRGGDRLLVPASNLKLVVSAAAAHHLDPEFRFRTSLLATGPVRDGVLEGDLVLVGRGDPMLSARYFPSRTAALEVLADSLRARGIRRINGGVIADESWFDSEYVRPDWDADDLEWWYAAPVNALGFND